MKREYFAPQAELCEVQTIQMVAGSIKDGQVEQGQTGVMSRDRQGDWNNIWGN